MSSLLRKTKPILPRTMPSGAKGVKNLMRNYQQETSHDKEGNAGVFDAINPPKPGSARDKELGADLDAMRYRLPPEPKSRRSNRKDDSDIDMDSNSDSDNDPDPGATAPSRKAMAHTRQDRKIVFPTSDERSEPIHSICTPRSSS